LRVKRFTRSLQRDTHLDMKHTPFIYLFSEELGLPLKTVSLFARNLKEAGLLTSGARGVNAPNMTWLDLVRMTIAVCATDRPSEVVRLVAALKDAPAEDSMSSDEGENFGYEAGESLETVLQRVFEYLREQQELQVVELRVINTGSHAILTWLNVSMPFFSALALEPGFADPVLMTSRSLETSALCALVQGFSAASALDPGEVAP
jgi:hypothetical protein